MYTSDNFPKESQNERVWDEGVQVEGVQEANSSFVCTFAVFLLKKRVDTHPYSYTCDISPKGGQEQGFQEEKGKEWVKR